ncbi:MAG: hypothetical protein WC841_03245 [Candidatus Shapirobacteria bacterium]
MAFAKTIFVKLSVLGKFWQEKINGTIFRWNALTILIQLAFIFFKFDSLPKQVPLYYSLPWGSQRLASASSLFLLPSFSIFFSLINNVLSAFTLHSIQVISRLLVVFSLIYSILSLITLIHIVYLVS